MGALAIDCYLSEGQMTKIVKEVEKHINREDDIRDLSDFDDVIEGVRICVDFTYMGSNLIVKAAEILDDNWETLYEDTAVFNSRLKSILADFNKHYIRPESI